MKQMWCGVVILSVMMVLGGVVVSQEGNKQPPGQAKGGKPQPDQQPPLAPGGPPPFGGGGPGGFKGGMFGQDRKLVKQFDKDGNGWLNQAERQAAREFLKKEKTGGGFGKGGPGGFGKGGKGGPGGFGKGGPGGFTPGAFLTKPLLEALDTDKDSKVSQPELTAGVKKFYADVDKDKKGSLDEEQIAEGLNRILPKPKFIFGGPPGGGPGGPPPGPKPGDAPPEALQAGGPPGGGPGGFGPPGGFGGFGPGKPFAASIVKKANPNKAGKITLKGLLTAAEALFKEADKNKDGKLDEQELQTGISVLAPAPGGFGPPGGFGKGNREPAKPGLKVKPDEATSYPKASLYEPTVLRTIFLEFENKDWEEELADFHNTDVEVPATVIVDGKKYANVGVHFRGMSSYGMVPAGYKRSLNLSMDLANSKQRLYGYKTLNLLNSADDPSFLHTILYSHIARQYIPAPKANLVKVVINGESWGIYVNAQQFNKDFIKENYKTTKGNRWKVRGSPGAASGLEYIGDNIDSYKGRYTIKSKDNEKAWQDLVTLTRTLNKTPTDKLEEALKPMLDIDGVLWFLALDNALINNDGYWVRASDFSIYQDPKGKFHIIPHDINETFSPAMGFGFGFGGGKGGPGGKGPGGFGGGPGKGGGVELDPLVGLDNARTPLRSKLLAVPSLKAKYLQNMRTIAEVSLNWKNLKPVVDNYRNLIEKEIEIDTRKLSSLAEFKSVLSETGIPGGAGGPFGKGRGMNLKAFADQRSQFLLNYPAIKKAAS